MTFNDWLDYFDYEWKYCSIPTFVYISEQDALKMIEIFKRENEIKKKS